MSSGLATVALVSAVMFTTWALYISLVEHPARLDSGAGPGRAQFQPSYRRAAPWQASFAVIACASGVATALTTGRSVWLAGAVAVGAVVPFTLLVIMPTNRALLGGAPLGDGDARRLLQRWGRLHAVRTVLGGVGVLAFLFALGQR
jgi:Domain of unknown function (DUF1772)